MSSIRDIVLILWLCSLTALAQNTPERTKPAVEETPQLPPANKEEVKNPPEPKPVWRQATQADETLEEENKKLREKVSLLEQLTNQENLIRLRAEELRAQKARQDAEKKRKKTDEDRFTRQARREREKLEQRERDAQKRAANAIGNADIFCPDDQRLHEVKILNTNHFIYNRFQAFNRVTVMNPGPATIRISAIDPNRNRSGAVADLPGGCSITLSRSIVPLLETGWGGIRFSYLAQPLEGRNAGKIARSQEFFLYGGNSFQQMNTSVWEVWFY